LETALDSDDYRLSAMGGFITELRLLLSSEFIEARVCVLEIL
jgi:hypothetical protein